MAVPTTPVQCLNKRQVQTPTEEPTTALSAAASPCAERSLELQAAPLQIFPVPFVRALSGRPVPPQAVLSAPAA